MAGTGPSHPVIGPVEMRLTESVDQSDRCVAVATRDCSHSAVGRARKRTLPQGSATHLL